MNTIIEKINTNTEKNQIKESDANQEILENLNQEIIFQVRGEKQIDKKIESEKEKKEALALASKREVDLGTDLSKREENEEISRKTATNINKIAGEVIRNIACYSTHNKAIIFQLIKLENKESQEISYKIRSRNYYIDPDGKKTSDLETRLKEGNEGNLNEIREKHQQQMSKEGFGEYNNAGLGYFQLARRLRKENLNPFEYKFSKQKDGTVRFDLTLNIKQANK